MRYAVYFTPSADHPLWRAGCDWLQRDPTVAATTAPPRPHVGEPRRYGFHATLKAPMRLADGRSETSLHGALTQLARHNAPFAMPVLSVQWLGDFLALRPVEPLPRSHLLHQLADTCVTELDAWRAPTSPQELHRRLRTPLDDTQRELLHRYGYPHVMDHWRFHMTLTDALPADADLRATLQHQAAQHFAPALAQPLVCESVCLFVEPAPGEPFRLAQRFAFVP